MSVSILNELEMDSVFLKPALFRFYSSFIGYITIIRNLSYGSFGTWFLFCCIDGVTVQVSKKEQWRHFSFSPSSSLSNKIDLLTDFWKSIHALFLIIL